MRLAKLTTAAVVGLLLLGIYGCNTSEPFGRATVQDEPNTSAGTTGEVVSNHDHGDHDHGDPSADGQADGASMEEKMSGLKTLSAEDYESAMAQHVCPVSGEMLGTMGTPEKVDVNGKSVWICCEGCKDKLLADPDKYLAELNKQGSSN